MLQMPITDVISKISEHTKLSEKDIKEKIKEKLDSLNGLVSDEGAAYIIANELGVKLFEEQTSNKVLKIKDVLVGAKSVDTIGKVTKIFEIRKFTRDGTENKVGNFIIADETGTLKVVLWDAKRIEWLEDGTVKVGNVVKIKNGYVKENKFAGGKEVHLGVRGQLVIDEETKIDVKVSKEPATERDNTPVEAKIADAKPGGNYKFRGTVVRAFAPNFYDACSKCGKKVQMEGAKGTCKEHGEVEFQVTPILNIVLDDGTENIRCTAFRELAETLAGEKANEMKKLGESSTEQLQELIDKALVGKELQVEGYIRENKQFDRVELMMNKATEEDPVALIKNLEGDK